MTCKECEKQIPDFIEQKQDYPALKRFCEHIDGCDACKEELTIKFLVTEGLIRMENGSSFDLQKELDRRMSDAKRIIEVHSRFIRIGYGIELAGFCILIGIAISLLL